MIQILSICYRLLTSYLNSRRQGLNKKNMYKKPDINFFFIIGMNSN